MTRDQASAVIFFALADLLAAIGLWLATPWGGVLWLVVVAAEGCRAHDCRVTLGAGGAADRRGGGARPLDLDRRGAVGEASRSRIRLHRRLDVRPGDGGGKEASVAHAALGERGVAMRPGLHSRRAAGGGVDAGRRRPRHRAVPGSDRAHVGDLGTSRRRRRGPRTRPSRDADRGARPDPAPG